ncbi:MAG: DUF4178 domain-containing protein [Deltaproteobacteria bacterium]|nr:DUF4178 domain-containing protein [Deltaproteobacteria bacterium]
MFVWILIVLLAVVGGVTAVSVAARRKALPGGPGQRALPPGTIVKGDNLLERGVRDLRVDDVLTIDGRDFVCEGLLAYDEDGHRWNAGRVVDAGDVKWLLVGIERAAASSTRLLAQDESNPITGYPPEALVLGEIRYVLDKRGAATCQMFGDVGGLGALKHGRPEGHVERCRWWLYSAPGDDTLLVEQWGNDYRLLRGKKIGEGTVELLPAS